MSIDVLSQYVMNALMLGMNYAMVAVGFTLFFVVLDVIQFSHGDVLQLGGFDALCTYMRAFAIAGTPPWAQLAPRKTRHPVSEWRTRPSCQVKPVLR